MDLLQGRIVRAGVKTDVWYLQTCFLWRQQLLFTDGITGAATSAVSRGTHLVWAECPHALDSRQALTMGMLCWSCHTATPEWAAQWAKHQALIDRLQERKGAG